MVTNKIECNNVYVGCIVYLIMYAVVSKYDEVHKVLFTTKSEIVAAKYTLYYAYCILRQLSANKGVTYKLMFSSGSRFQCAEVLSGYYIVCVNHNNEIVDEIGEYYMTPFKNDIYGTDVDKLNNVDASIIFNREDVPDEYIDPLPCDIDPIHYSPAIPVTTHAKPSLTILNTPSTLAEPSTALNSDTSLTPNTNTLQVRRFILATMQTVMTFSVVYVLNDVIQQC